MKPTATKASELESKLAQKGSILLDIRETYEYEDDHLDSLHIPMAEVKSRLKELADFGQIVICCRSGKRAFAMNHTLNQLFPNKQISYLEGGIEAYRSLTTNA